MQRRQEPAPENKNRATGFSDADWGALEKRLSDTRDLLQDILLHLRRVLDNLKTVGDTYQTAGRAWRRTDSAAGAGRAYGTRASGTAGGGDTRKTTSGAKSHAGPGASGAGGNGTRFQAAGSRASGAGDTAGASGAQGRQTTFGASRPNSTSSAHSAGGQTFAGTAGRAGATGASGARASQDRQAGNGFSWSSRTRTDSTSSSSSNFTGGSQQQQKASSHDWRAQREARPGSGAGERTDSRAGSRDSFGSQSRQERSGSQGGAQSGQQSHSKGHQQSHRTTGAGGGSSYQDYRQRTHKSPLGSGRMTLTQACALLCIVYPCTADDIKSAYRKQARRHHPDLGGNEEMMKSINQAYELALSWCSPLRGKSATWAA